MSTPIPNPATARRAHALALLASLACAACTPSPDTPTEKPVEPRATELRDAVRQPLDRAREAQATLDDAAARQRETIDAAGG